MGPEHRIHLGDLLIHGRGIGSAVALGHDDVLNGVRRRRALLCRNAQYEHRQGKGIGRQVQQTAHGLGVFHHISYVAAPQPHRLGSDDRCLGRDDRILRSDGELPHAGSTPRALSRLLDKRWLKTPRMLKQVGPFCIVDHKNERPRRRCYERLVVAEHRQLIQRFLVADIDDRVHHHRARRRCARSRMQDRGALLVCHRVLRELSRGGTRLDDLEHIAPPRALLRWPCASFARLFPALESILGFCSSLHNAPSPHLPCAAVDVAATVRPLSHATVAVRLQPRAAATARSQPCPVGPSVQHKATARRMHRAAAATRRLRNSLIIAKPLFVDRISTIAGYYGHLLSQRFDEGRVSFL